MPFNKPFDYSVVKFFYYTIVKRTLARCLRWEMIYGGIWGRKWVYDYG